MVKRDLSAVWTVLDSAPPESAVEAVGIGYQVAAGELMAGVDQDLRRYLLIPLLPGEAARQDTKGRAVHLARLEYSRMQYLAVVCVLPELHSVFTQFSRELVASINDAESPARAAAEAFDRWRALFAEAALRGGISEERLIGLIGELLSLESLLENLAPPEISYWRGPFGDSQDFRAGTHALEVKTTLVREGRVISISSVDQLQKAPNTSLYLQHHRLERDPSGFNIGDLHQRLITLGASPSALAAGFSENGLEVSDLSAHDGYRYRVSETRTYDTDGFGFPKITRDSFRGGDLPAGTLHLSYSIDLTNEPPMPLSVDELSAVLTKIAEEAADGMGT